MKRLLSLILALALLLSFAACGEKGDPRQSGVTVYEPETVSVASYLETLEGYCVSGDSAYLLCRANGSGGTPLTLLRVPEGGGELEPLPDYEPVAESRDGSYRGITLQAGTDGTLWEAQQVLLIRSDGDAYWTETETILRHLDGNGAELSRVDLGTDLEKRLELESLLSLTVDGGGRILAQGSNGQCAVLDQMGATLFTLPSENGGYVQLADVAVLSDGRLGVLSGQTALADGTVARTLRTVDPEKKGWGEEFQILGDRQVSVFSGGGEALFYYLNGNTLCAWRQGAEAGEPLLNLLDVYVDRFAVTAVAGGAGGEVTLLTDDSSSYPQRPDGVQLVRLVPTDATQVEKKVLTLATVNSYTSLEKAVMEFNRASEEYRVTLTDYSQYGGSEAGMARLITEINSGKVPDLLATYGLPVAQWGEKGLLEDLWPYIDSDPDLDREDLMLRVLETSEIGGKLCVVGDGFYISTLIGAKDLVGDRMSWTKEDMMSALEKMPEDCAPYGYRSRTDLLDTMLDWSKLVDRTAGTCDFEGKTFRSLLEFCAAMPEGDPGNGRHGVSEQMVSDKRHMLLESGMYSFSLPVVAETLLGGEISYVGYPDAWGGVGSWFTLEGGVAMSSTCREKKGAWAFVRSFLLPQKDLTASPVTFPINRSDFERMAEKAMDPGYAVDDDGELILDEKGKPIPLDNYMRIRLGSAGSLEINATISREQYGQLMDLYNSIERSYWADSSLEAIVHSAAAPYFAGKATLDETAEQIQSRVTLYLGEQG